MFFDLAGLFLSGYLLLYGLLRRGAPAGAVPSLILLAVLAAIALYRGRLGRWKWALLLFALIGLVSPWLWLGALFLPLARRRRPDRTSLRVGRRYRWGGAVFLATEDRFLHLQVLGPTGSGKSLSALWPFIAQDLENGAGVTVLDPKGELVELAARRAAELGRAVRRLDPHSPDGLGYNPLAGPREAAAERLAYILEKGGAGSQAFFDTLARNFVRHSVLALKEVREEAVLTDLERFWLDEEYMLETLRLVRDPETRRYFHSEYGQWTPRVRVEYTLGARSRIGELLAGPDLRRLLTRRPAVDIPGVLARGEVLLGELPVDRWGVGAQVLGALLLADLQWATFGRGGGPAHFLYVDEFQNFAREGFGEFLAAARSYRVGAVLAHQNLGQLGPELRGSVLANARNRLVFGGLAGADRREVWGDIGAGRAGGLDDRMLRHLPRGRFLALLTRDGRALPPVVLRGEPLRRRPLRPSRRKPAGTSPDRPGSGSGNPPVEEEPAPSP